MTFTIGETDRLVGQLCIECGQPFRVGERVVHIPESTTKHAACPDEYDSDPF